MAGLEELIRYGIENVSILEYPCSCEPGGTFSVVGLPYRSSAWDVVRAGRDAEAYVVAVIDPQDMTKVLVREPSRGWLLSAPCLEPGVAAEVSFWGHLERLALAYPGEVSAIEERLVRALEVGDRLQAA